MKDLRVILKGLWIGSTMTVPGVSGGTMAVIIGIYEELIHAINGFRKEPLKYLPFLIKFVLGAGIGFLFFARCVTLLLQGSVSGELTRFFFCGVVLGGIPLLVSKAQLKKIKFTNILSILFGAMIVWILSLIPEGVFCTGAGKMQIVVQFIGGILIAVALILPGISVTHILYILGMYEYVIAHIYSLQFLKILPIGVGVIVGTFVTTDILETIMKRYTTTVYMVIIGFVAASMTTLFPEGEINHLLLGSVLFLVGFFVMYAVSRKANKSNG